MSQVETTDRATSSPVRSGSQFANKTPRLCALQPPTKDSVGNDLRARPSPGSIPLAHIMLAVVTQSISESLHKRIAFNLFPMEKEAAVAVVPASIYPTGRAWDLSQEPGWP